MITSSTQLQNRSFHVAERTRTSAKCQKWKLHVQKYCFWQSGIDLCLRYSFHFCQCTMSHDETILRIELIMIIIMFNVSIAQINMWIWSNALYNSRRNQINIAQITILQLLFTNQVKCWFLMMRGENRSTWGKTSHSRVENQQTQSTYDTECRNRTRATLVEGKCSHH